MEMDIGRLAIMTLALGAGAIVKGATGMGLPLVALPVLTTVFGLQHAVGLMCVPLIFTNAWQVWRFRASARDDRMAFLPLFLAGGAIGIGLGTWALTSLPERALVLTLGIILLGHVALKLMASHFVLGRSSRGGWGHCSAWGVASSRVPPVFLRRSASPSFTPWPWSGTPMSLLSQPCSCSTRRCSYPPWQWPG